MSEAEDNVGRDRNAKMPHEMSFPYASRPLVDVLNSRDHHTTDQP